MKHLAIVIQLGMGLDIRPLNIRQFLVKTRYLAPAIHQISLSVLKSGIIRDRAGFLKVTILQYPAKYSKISFPTHPKYVDG